jgi:hypothetical protein
MIDNTRLRKSMKVQRVFVYYIPSHFEVFPHSLDEGINPSKF